MKISVFGSTGFIGSRFCELYPDEVLPVPRDKCTTEEPSQVLYLISTTHNYDTWEVNINTNINCLLETLQQHRKEDVFNFVSSWFVYDFSESPATEDVKLGLKYGNYSLTKLWAEQLVQSYCIQNDIPWRIFRLANVFGKGDRFSKHKNALQYLISKMKVDEDIYLANDGLFYRDYIHVDLVCKVLHTSMTGILWTDDIFNVGSGKSVLFRNMILAACVALESKSLIKYKSSITSDFWMDISKLKSYGILKESSPFDALYRMLKDGI